MQFEALVNSILKETIEHNIPVLDGTREIYLVRAVALTDIAAHSAFYRPLKRLEPETEFFFNDPDDTILIETSNFIDAYDTFKHKIECVQYISQQDLSKVKSQSLNDINKLKDIAGNFKVTSYQDGFYLSFMVDVDLDAYKQSSHAAEDLYGF